MSSRPATKPIVSGKPDVCLVLEGTYPYVAGGVSTWVHQIITALPDIRFSIVYIGSEKNPDAKYKYTLPANVLSVEEIYLHEPAKPTRHIPDAPEGSCAALQQLLHDLLQPGISPELESRILYNIAQEIMTLSASMSFPTFWNDPGTWDLVSEIYEEHASGESFLDFYWSLRGLAEPMWRLLAGIRAVPPARLYHSLCTGYAGFVSGVAALSFESSCLLSEHGIYVRERVADLQKARWLVDPPVIRPDIYRDPALLRRLWIGFFQLLGRFAYQTSSHITSLFARNAELAEEFGAVKSRMEIIPNGIESAAFYPLRGKRKALLRLNPGRMNIGFLGRVVPIKDVKTLLKCARIVVTRLPQAKFIIAGPTDEDPAYAAECTALAGQLQLGDSVTFAGPQQRDEFLPQLDIMLLTSVSEGLPFVILESFAADVPCVSTDVGACRELIEGRPGENPAFGPAGMIAPVGNAEALAEALITMLTHPEMLETMGLAGRARSEAHYSQESVVARYRALYSCQPTDFARSGRPTTRQLHAAYEAAGQAATAGAREAKARLI